MRDGPACADVVIVGLGPVGGVLAALLGEQGVDVLVLEADLGVAPLPRAIAADGETRRTLLDVLGPAGRDLFLVGREVQVRDARGRLVTTIAFPGVDDREHNPIAQPGLSFFHQPALETALRARLATLPSVRVWPGTRLRAVRDVPGAVVAVVEDGTTVRAAYLVGCDGAGSTVRRARGIAYTGRTFAQPWLVIDLECPPLPELDTFRYVLDPARPAVMMPRPGGHRVEFLLRPGEDAADFPTERMLRQLLEPPLGAAGWAQVRLLRATEYLFHARTAERWRDGRVLLAGDAAHAMPPFGGQGMGAGIADAAALSWRLAEVVEGLASPSVLDAYAREQRPRVAAMTASALAIGRLLTPGRTATAAIVTAGLRAVSSAPVLGRRFRSGALRPVVPVPVPDPERRQGGGRPAPNPVLTRPMPGPAGEVPARLDDVLRRRWAVLAATDPRQLVDTATGAALTARAVQWLAVAPSDLPGLLSAPGDVVLVRPDRVVAYAGPAAGAGEVLRRLIGSRPG